MYNVSSLTLNPNGPILYLTLQNSGNGDRIGPETVQQLLNAFEFFEDDDTLRVLVIEGSNGIFSEGSTLNPDQIVQSNKPAIDIIRKHQVANYLSKITKPTIAVIDGKAYGQGLEIALACDIRIATSSASFGFPDSNNGIVPWDGATQRLPRLAGIGTATNMLLMGKLLTASEALSVGLIVEIVPTKDLHPTAVGLAEQIATSAPIAARYIKEAIKGSGELPLGEGLRLEADLNMLLFSTTDRAEGVSSFLEKRSPEFRGS